MSNDLQPRLGKAARTARKRLGLTPQQAADELGISGAYYTRIEWGHVVPSVRLFARMISILKVHGDVLLGNQRTLH